ncbi:LysR family transcriptional regulator [Leisingera sp. SS27]|uniref:LysR family transcriptional regulator n=1 Tax=Leisingera sp. SS27 TaxID=2979462 RepID=UPI00232CE317|nr:LysR family transcriptional regulator [Leisingera sp. SS27]MDC0659388.1 LysR family transcriptional regulator [Leisingera sp. SS27]
MRIGLRHIRYFIAVAEELHFRRAAVRLNIAQPALSRAIQHLERELQVSLFERSNRATLLTEAGRVFLDGCRGVLTATELAVENARQADQGQIGSLRIGCTDFAIGGCLPDLLKTFQQEFPGITLKPHHGVTTEQLHRLEDGTLDVGFVTGPVNLPDIASVSVQQEHLLCIVYEGHPLAHRSSIRLEELAAERFVHGPAKDWEYFYYHFLPLCRRAGFMPDIVQEAYNSAAILGLVASRMGVTVLAESTCRTPPPGLVSIPFEDVMERLETIAIWKKSSCSGAMNRFVEFLALQQGFAAGSQASSGKA